MSEESKEVGWLAPQWLDGEVTAVSYTAPKGQSFEDWDEDGRILLVINSVSRWALGDWMNAGGVFKDEARWQGQAIPAREPNWWNEGMRVASCVPPENRRPELPWSYHLVVAPLELHEQRLLLDECIRENWNIVEMREHAALVKNGRTPLEQNNQSADDYKDAKDGKPKVDKAKPKGLTDLTREAKKAEAIRKRQVRVDRQEVKAAKKAEENRRRKAERTAKARGEPIPPPATPELPDEVYQVLLADPPWRYEDPPMGVTNRSIENHYDTMPLAELVKLPVSELAADDAVMFMWSTAPNLPAAMTLLEAWGFKYRTQMIWRKSKVAMGHYVRNQHEIILIGKRGEPVMPLEKDRPPSVFDAPTRQHSQKPDITLQIIERMYPHYSRIYLFPGEPLPRAHRGKWATWGKDHREPVRQAAE